MWGGLSCILVLDPKVFSWPNYKDDESISFSFLLFHVNALCFWFNWMRRRFYFHSESQITALALLLTGHRLCCLQRPKTEAHQACFVRSFTDSKCQTPKNPISFAVTAYHSLETYKEQFIYFGQGRICFENKVLITL